MSKRGDGTTYTRKDGRHCAALVFETGQKPVVRYAKTEAEAEKLLREMRKARDAGLVTGRTQRVADYLSEWLENVKKPHITPHSRDGYEDRIGLILGKLGSTRIGDLTPARIRRCQADLLADGLSTRYVGQILSLLSSALADAVHDRILTWNPCDAVTPPKATRYEMQTLSLAQVQELFASSRETRYYPLWALLCMTGLRIGEATALRWQDVDYERSRSLSVRHTLSRAHERGWLLQEPKTAAGRRTIELGDIVCTALREQRQRQRKERLEAFEWQDNGFVFTGQEGQPLVNNTIRHALRSALTAARLPIVRVHDLRHTCATIHLHELGTPPKVVQEMLGHSTYKMTMDIYGHVLPGMHRDAADKLNQRMKER